MKSVLCALLISALVSSPVVVSAQDQAKPFVLEDGTPIKLVLSQNLSSATAHTGDLVAFETVEDVRVDGVLVIPRGSTAWATITDAQHKRRLGRAGHLEMNIDKVRLADGEKVLLRAVQGGSGGGHQGAMIGAMVATSLFTLGGSALFLLMHGKDMNIPEGTQVTAFVQGNAVLDPAKFAPQSAPVQSAVPAPAQAPASAAPTEPDSQPAQPTVAPSSPTTPQKMTVISDPAAQQPSLGEIARKNREQKAAAQQSAQQPPQQ